MFIVCFCFHALSWKRPDYSWTKKEQNGQKKKSIKSDLTIDVGYLYRKNNQIYLFVLFFITKKTALLRFSMVLCVILLCDLNGWSHTCSKNDLFDKFSFYSSWSAIFNGFDERSNIFFQLFVIKRCLSNRCMDVSCFI